MAFQATTQVRLRKIFNLEAYQDFPSSELKSLMNIVEGRDTQYSTTHVAEIEGYLDELDTASTGLISKFESESLKDYQDLTVPGEYSVSYGTTAGTGSSPGAGYKKQIEDRKEKIRKLLEPDNNYYPIFWAWWNEKLLLRGRSRVISS